MSYVYQPYPRMLYLASQTAIATSVASEAALVAAGWQATPPVFTPDIDVLNGNNGDLLSCDPNVPQQLEWVSRQRLTGVYNVKDFWAVGDGVTDDTAAIQESIDAAMSSGGGTVYLPRGVYRHSGLIIPGTTASPAYVNIHGASGYGQTLLRHVGSGVALTVVDNRYFTFQNFMLDRTGSGTAGILFTGQGTGTSTQAGVLINVVVGEFVDGAGFQFGETSGEHSASEMTLVGCHAIHNKYGVDCQSLNTAAIWLMGIRTWNNEIGLRYVGDPNYTGFPINVNGASASANGIDFQLLNPTTLTVANMISEGKAGEASYGRLLQTGVASGCLSNVPIRVSMTGVVAYHSGDGMAGGHSVECYGPTHLSIAQSVIGKGVFYLSGNALGQTSRLNVDSTILWDGVGTPVEMDADCGTPWNVSLKGVTYDPNGIHAVPDSETLYRANGTSVVGVQLTNTAGTVTKRVRLNDAGNGLTYEDE
jgi:hypothetical protein